MAQDTLLGFPATPSLPSRRIYRFIDSLVFYDAGHEKAAACLLHSFYKALPTLIMSAL